MLRSSRQRQATNTPITPRPAAQPPHPAPVRTPRRANATPGAPDVKRDRKLDLELFFCDRLAPFQLGNSYLGDDDFELLQVEAATHFEGEDEGTMARIQARLLEKRNMMLELRRNPAPPAAAHHAAQASSAFAMRDIADALTRVVAPVAAAPVFSNMPRKAAMDAYTNVRQTHEEQRTLQAFVANLAEGASSSTEQIYTARSTQRLVRFALEKFKNMYRSSEAAFFRVGLDVDRFGEQHLELQRNNAAYRQIIQIGEDGMARLYEDIMGDMRAEMTQSGTDSLWIEIKPQQPRPAIAVPLSSTYDASHEIHRDSIDRLVEGLKHYFESYHITVAREDQDVWYKILSAELASESDEMINGINTTERLLFILAAANKRARDETQVALQRSTDECLRRMTEVNQRSIAEDIADTHDKNVRILRLIFRMMAYVMFKGGILVVPLHPKLLQFAFHDYPFASDFCIKVSGLCLRDGIPAADGLLHSMGHICKMVGDICFILGLTDGFTLSDLVHYPVERQVEDFMNLVFRFVAQRQGESDVTIMDLHKFMEELRCPITCDTLDENSIVLSSGAHTHVFSSSAMHALFNTHGMFEMTRGVRKTVKHPMTRVDIGIRDLRKPSLLLTLILKYNGKLFKAPRSREIAEFAAVPVHGYESHARVDEARRNLHLEPHKTTLI